ncbi:MAG: protein kinase [Acidobacteria bacterium]|nr:protein kinase [Acidobacteriota bacterium]MCL5287211.1 protein kinase [Acidobacteriota bacterium]
MTGSTVGHYRVTAKLGAGGMGEVYLAEDTKLGRQVALKVIPPAFAQDAHRMARFQREAQVLASLNHPNIATIHGLEDDGTVRALVMELVEGPTLAEKIVGAQHAAPAQTGMPLDEALPIAKQIAEGLEYAHERGVIHRDLKPANVKITHDGKVKILDFGLAKALSDDSSVQDEAFSPTLSAVASKTGIILGTAAYMSPEQAKGKPVDRRADIWSFGVLLYEMLTGQRLYTGETASETLAHVITKDPALDVLPVGTPRRIRRLLARCLTRDPKARLQAIGEARIAIEQVIAQPAEEIAGPEASGLAAQSAPPAPAWQRALPWAVAILAVVTAALSSWAPWRPAPALVPTPAIRMSVEMGAPASLVVDRGPSVVLSPDGTRLALVAQDAKLQRQIYVRNIDQLQATPLAGTDGARDPFFSPDGTWIAFFAGGKLKKISVQGGAAVTLCDAPAPFGGSWGENDAIVFAPDSRTALFRVSSAGGKPEPLTKLDQSKGELTHRWPQVLPGGEAVLFGLQMPVSLVDEGNIVVQSLKSGERRTVVEAGTYGRYVPSGHILYAHRGNLFAVPFDLSRLEVTGPRAPFLERVVFASLIGGAQYSFSNTGSFVYVTGESQASKSVVDWMDRAGKFQPLQSVPADYVNPRISPDGKQLSLNVIEGGSADVWVYDWARDTMTRLTFDPGNDIAQMWTPDGQRIGFASNRGGAQNLYWQRADGAGEAQRLTESKNTQFAYSWTPDGKTLAFHEMDPVTGNDIWVLPIDGDEKSGWKPGTPQLFLKTPFAEATPFFSPDGRWLAYQSNESGRNEVYVRPFPGGDGKWMVSSEGGILPRWLRSGKELFYLRPEDNRIMVVNYREVDGSFQADKPVLWSPGQFADLGGRPNYDVAPDGKRFAVLRFPEGKENAEKNDKFVLILNVFEELRRRVPAGKK